MSSDFFEIKDSEVNVEEIMQQIRENINNRNINSIEFPELTPTLPEGSSYHPTHFDMSEFEHNIMDVNNTFNIQTHNPLSSHRKTLGRIIVFLKKVVRKSLKWYINPPFDMQREFNASVTRSLNQLRAYVFELEKDMVSMRANLSAVNEFVLGAKNIDAQGEKKVEFDRESLQNFEERLKQKEAAGAASQMLHSLLQRMENAEQNLQGLNRSTEAAFNTNLIVGNRLRRVEKTLKETNLSENGTKSPCAEAGAGGQSSIGQDKDVDIDYIMFEQKYRGSSEEISERQNMYLKYFQNKGNVLDIGCGRGEFLQLLLNSGIKAKGIDLDKEMVLHCREKGLPVEVADAVGYLGRVEDESLDGIFMAQVIEHLKPAELLRLIRLSQSKLRKGGVIIMETINPQCLSVFANSFYMDMSHEKPVHPLTLKFVLEAEGMQTVDLLYLSEIKDKIPPIKSAEIQNLEEINKSLERVNRLLFGAQDYALVARK